MKTFFMGKIYMTILNWNDSFLTKIYKATAVHYKKTAFALVIVIMPFITCAQVTITAPQLTVTTCGTFPTNYFSLGDIVIKEQNNADFSSTNNGTLILTAPANFEFQPGTASVSYATGANVSSASVTVTATVITITYTVSNSNKNDQITLSGIKVRGINGIATNQKVTRTSGTGIINGDANGAVHASLSSQILPTPAITTLLSQASCSGSSTNIALTSNPSGATFSWATGTIDNVSGASSGSGNVITQTLTSVDKPGTVEYVVTPLLNGCSGAPTSMINTVNPKASVNTVPNQVVCNNSGTTAISFSSPTTGGQISYSWSNNNTNIGLAYAGSGDIASFTATNSTNSPITATITVTPSYSNAGVTCTGTATSFTITVNPTPTVNTVTDQAACVNTSTAGITFTSPSNSVTYSWANNNTAIGLAASGTGNLPSFTAKNPGISPVTSVITVTPVYKTAELSCTGTSSTFNYTVFPIATVNTVTNQTVCNNSPTADINFSSAGSGTITYNWTNNAPYIGLPASGTGNIPSFSPVNGGSTPIIATITVTPSYNGCPGTSTTFTITVNPTPTMDNVADQVFCNNSTAKINFTTPTTGTIIYNWTNSNTNIGLAASGTGNISALNAKNTGIAPISSTVTVTPSINNAGKVCVGAPDQFNIVVNPTPTINAIDNQTFCDGSSVSSMAVSSPVPGSVFTWVNDNSTIGLAGAGNGDVPSFTARDTGNAPVTTPVRLNATYTNGGLSCSDVSSFNITVNPAATVSAVTNQVVCNNAPTEEVDFNTPAVGPGTITYNWVNNNTTIGLAKSGTGNVPSFTAVNTGNSPVTATITVTAVYSNGGKDSGGTATTFTITVNPTPKVSVTDQVACNQSTFTPAAFSTTATGGATTYTWTNSNTAIGLAANGSGNLPAFTASNPTNDVAIATVKVTPVFTNAGVSCQGPENSFAIVINPTATVDPVSDQTICNLSRTTAVHFSTTTRGTGTVSYYWENNTTSIGLAKSGTGDIPAFTATNTGTAPVTATIKVTPYYSNGTSSCPGTPQTFTITVNPTATVNAVSNQVVCNNGLTASTNFTSPVSGGSVTYSWTNTNSSIGLAGSGTGNIPAFTAYNNTNAAVTATITVTPLFTNGAACSGTPITFTITVNPTPTVTAVDDQTLCSNTPTNAITFAGNVAGTVYSWSNTKTSIGLASSGNGNIPSFTASNTGTIAQVASLNVKPMYTNAGVSCSGDTKSFTIKVNPLPVPSLSGPNPICPNTTDVYTTEAGMHNYTWTQTGGTMTSGGTESDNSATITWGNSAGVKTIYINYTDGNGCTGATSVTVANGVGSSPGLTGPSLVCEKSTNNVYSTESGKTNYSWNIPEGGTIISGGGSTDATATVRWDNPGNKVITVNYADLGGCNAATPTTYSVKVNPLPTAAISGTATVCLNSGPAKVTFTGATGTAPYTFTYKINGGTTQSVTTTSGNSVTVDQPSTSTGAYVYTLLTVQDASTTACVQNQTGSATITVKPLPTATISGTTAVCANSTAPTITFTGSTGTAPYTFTYNINGGSNQTVSTGAGSSSVTVAAKTTAAGIYKYNLVSVKESSANTCGQTQSGSATVTVNPLPTAAISGTTTVCIGSASPNITFTGSGATAPYTFTYSINGNPARTISTSSGNSVTLAAPANVAGTFTYSVLSVKDASSTGCVQTVSGVSATIKVDSKPVGGILSPDLITGACSGSNSGSITLSGQTGNVTRWEFSTNGGASWSTVSPNVTSTTLTYSNLTATSLYRAVLQNGVCSDTAVSKNTVVVVSPIFTPTVVYLPTLTICVGDTVTMSASGLSNDKTSLVDGEFDNANPAGWNVTYNGTSINFPANADNAKVNPWSETNGPKTYFSGTPDEITYDSQFDKKFAIANGAITTTLETPVFSLVGMVSPTFDFYQAYNLKDGTIAKIEISTDGGAHYTGILAQYFGTFGVPNDGLVHSFVPLTNYIGLDNVKVKFTYSSTGNSTWALDNLKLVNSFLPVSYLWNSEGYTYTTQTINVSPPVGTHLFNLVTQTGLCSITTTQLTVIVNGYPTITPGTATVCTNSSAQTLTLPYTNPTYSPSNFSITWNSPTNGLLSLADTILSSTSIPVTIPAGVPAGNYTGTVKVKNGNGCISPATPFSIAINQTPVISNQTPAAICSTGSITLNSANFTGTNTIPSNTTYTWSAPSVSGITGLSAGNAQSSFTTGSLINTTSQPITVVYTVIPKSPSACPGAPFTISVTVNPTQIISTIPGNITLCPQPFTSVSTTFSVQAANATVYQWQENRGSGWVNITNGANYSGVTTNTLTVNNITEAMEGYQYRSSLANPSFCYSTYSDAATLLITNVWKGTTSSDWSTPSNWWGNVVPDINCQYVIIPTVSTKLYPILKGTETEEVRNIVIRQNASVTVTQSATLQVRGAIYSNIANYQYGYLDATDGRIELNGGSSHTYLGTDTAQVIAGSLFKLRTLKDLQISNPLSATVKSTPNDTLNITGTLSFGPVNNTTLHTGDNITLISNVLGTARVADITNASVNSGNNFDGDVIVERYINTGEGAAYHQMAWEFLAVPTQGQTIKQSWMENGSFARTGYGTQIPSTYGTAAGFDLYSPFASIKYYKPGSSPTNLTSPDWLGVTNTSLPLYIPSGYMIYVAGDRSVSPPFYQGSNPTRMRSKGKLFTYKVPIALTGSAFNSIGNPYASAIDMRKVLAESPDVSPFYTAWASPQKGTYGFGAFVTYSKSGSDFVSTPGGKVNNNVESGQAFIVQAGPSNGNIIFNETSKVSGSSYTVFRVPVDDVAQIRTNLYTNNGKNDYLLDGTLSEFNDAFNPKVDMNDAWKIFNGGVNISIVTEKRNLIIERTQIPKDNDTIFFSSTGLQAQKYRLEFVSRGMSSTGVDGFLLDNYLQTLTPLNVEDTTIINFAVNNDKRSSDPGRFRIVFKKKLILPVKTFFHAQPGKANNGEVAWNVIHEKNIRQYEIERSSNNMIFSKVYSVAALNTDSSNYKWTDENLLPGTYYYRLKTIDIEGKVSYTPAVRVLIGNGNPLIKIYPNPITDGVIHLQMLNMPAGKYQLRLTDQWGRMITSRQIERAEGSDVQDIRWNYQLSHGTFQLEIFQPDGQVKVIKVLY